MIASFGSRISTLSRHFGNSVSNGVKQGARVRNFSILRPPDDDTSNQSRSLMENFSEHIETLQKSPKPSAIAETFWWTFTHHTPLLQSTEFHHLCDLASTLGGSFSPEELTLLFRTSFEKMTKLHIPLLQSLTESLLQSRDLAPFPSVCIINILNSLSKRARLMTSGFNQEPNRQVLFPSQIEFVELLVLELGLEPRLKVLSPQELFQTVYSSLVLGLSGSPLLTPLKHRLSDRTMLESLHCKELAHLGYSLVKSSSEDDEILNDLVEVYGSNALSLGMKKELGLVLFTLGKMQKGIKIPTPILTLLKLIDRDLIASLRNEDISCFFYGLGKLGLRDLKLLKILSLEIQKKDRMSQLVGQQILSILTSMKDLDFQDQQLMISLSREVLVGIDPISKKPKLANFKYFELCGILHAWSRLGHHKQWALQVLVNELLRDSRQLEICGTSVGLLIHSLGLSSLVDPVILGVLEKSWLVSEKLETFDDRLLIMMIDGLTRLKTVRIFPILNPVLKEYTKSPRIHNSNTLRLVTCLYSLASLQQGHKDLDVVLILVKELNKIERILNMSDRCLSQVIYALGKLKFDQLDLLSAFVLECLKPRRLNSMDNQSVSNVLLGLGYFGYPDHSQVKILAWELLKPSRMDSIHEQNYIQLTNLVMTLGLLKVQSSESVLDQVCSILIKNNAIPVLKAIGLKNLIFNLVQLEYRNLAIYRILIREALDRDRRGKLFGRHLSMIFESIGKLGETGLFDELVLWGLRDLQDLQQYSSMSLSRFLIGFQSMGTTSNRPDLIQRLLKEQRRRRRRTKKQNELKFNKDDLLMT